MSKPIMPWSDKLSRGDETVAAILEGVGQALYEAFEHDKRATQELAAVRSAMARAHALARKAGL